MTTHLHAALATLTVALAVAASPCDAQNAKGPEGRAIARALKLLTKPPTVPIRVIDPDLAPDSAAIRRVDAFLVREKDGSLRQAIYLNRESSVVENALRGRDIDIAILATVIRHEHAHLAGASEEEARRVERDFFQGLIQAGRVPVDEGVEYLHVLVTAYRLREGD
jgi:hypothetical protein